MTTGDREEFAGVIRRRKRSSSVPLFGIGTVSLMAAALGGCSNQPSGTFHRNHYRSAADCFFDYDVSKCLSSAQGPIYFRSTGSFQATCRGFADGPGRFWATRGFAQTNPTIERVENIERGQFGPRCGRSRSSSSSRWTSSRGSRGWSFGS